MNKLDRDYLKLVFDILSNGTIKGDRTGTGTKSVFKREIRHNMKDGFPLLTTKKMYFNGIKTELRWFLNGGTNIKWLLDNKCNIWNGDAYKNYEKNAYSTAYNELTSNGLIHVDLDFRLLSKEEFIEKVKTDEEFAAKWGELGPIYGKQWTDWGGINQIENLVRDLQENPDSRRLMVNAWNVDELHKAVLPPCHYGFQCYTRKLTHQERYDIWFRNNFETGMEYNSNNEVDFDNSYYKRTPERALSLAWEQRSVDVGLGLPFNIASYGLLLLMLADEVGMIPDELIGSLGDCHIYLNHIEPIKEQLFREPLPLPKVIVRDGMMSCSTGDDIILQGYQSHDKIDLPLSN